MIFVISVDSGACCPGLIEAAVYFVRPHDKRAGIPGLAALASLKQNREKVSVDAFVPRIPGLAALASLKRSQFPYQMTDSLMDSGACCPGLIEATYDQPEETQQNRGDSGAYCPGLIEACMN